MIFFSTFNHLVNQKITFLYTFLYVQYPLASESRWGGGLNFHLFCKERHKFTQALARHSFEYTYTFRTSIFQIDCNGIYLQILTELHGEHIPRSMERLWQTVTYVGELIVVAESILLGQRQQVLFENWNVIYFILLALENRANAWSK